MTEYAELFLFGKLEGIYQNVKITPLKKIVASEVEFFDDGEKMNIEAKLAAFMKNKNILIEGEKLRMAGSREENNNRQLLWLGSSEKTADALFNALASFSAAEKINFLVNYHCAKNEEFNAEKKTVLTFHPEVIIDGHRLINDFPDVSLNRRFVVLGKWKVQDITYNRSNITASPISFSAACRQICEKTLASLDKYFNVDYLVSVLYGTVKTDYTGLAPQVRTALEDAF